MWHAWLRHDPIGLERFCRKHFGQVIPHVERTGLASDALAGMLMTGRRVEGIAPLGPRLPLLFGLDARLGKRGRRLGRAQLHPELTTSACWLPAW